VSRAVSRSKTHDRTVKPKINARPATVDAVPPPPRPVEELFAGARPSSFSRGLEPAFLLIDRAVMEQLRARAAALGIGGYDGLVKRILREHIAEY
jgi:hypothetical protein